MAIAFHAFAALACCATRRGRATSSPPQFGQRPCIESAHTAQNVHSWLQIRASAAVTGNDAWHRSHAVFIASDMGHFDSSKSSRPISIRRISDVPAPIS
jgi:hypothetical protein